MVCFCYVVYYVSLKILSLYFILLYTIQNIYSASSFYAKCIHLYYIHKYRKTDKALYNIVFTLNLPLWTVR